MHRKLIVELTDVVRKENKQFHAWCPELDVASCGDTVEEACENLHDAVELYLNTLTEVGELELVFQERGIKPIVEEEEPCSHTFVAQWRTPVKVLT